MHDATGTTVGTARGSSKPLRSVGLVLTAAVIAVGTALGAAAPASADLPPATTDPAVTEVPDDAGVQLGPATKFVRDDDGTVRQLR